MFAKRVRHINRYREIATALLSQGFDYIVEETGLMQKSPITSVFVQYLQRRILEA